MEQNDNYFSNGKSEAEKSRNVSSLVNDIVNTKPEESLEVKESESESEELPEVNPLVDLVGKTISAHKEKGFFMQGVQTDGNPKL